MQLSQIDENIRMQTYLIQQTRENIEYWRLNFNYLAEQQARLDELNNILAQQNEQLDLMREQRTLVAAEALNNTQAIQLQKQEALASVAQDRQAAQGEVENLRDSIIRLQQSQREIRNSQVSLNSQLRQAQEGLQNQQAEVRSLESAIEQKKQELDSLVQ
jgi:chromosome segregation ATPase